MGLGGKELLMKAAELGNLLRATVFFFFYQDTLETVTEQVRTGGEKYSTH